MKMPSLYHFTVMQIMAYFLKGDFRHLSFEDNVAEISFLFYLFSSLLLSPIKKERTYISMIAHTLKFLIMYSTFTFVHMYSMNN